MPKNTGEFEGMSIDLADRDEELSTLRELFAESAAGSGRMALITGPAAVGRTELCDAFAREAAASGALVVSVSASRIERSVPFAVLRQLLQHLPLPSAAGPRVNRLIADAVFSAVLREPKDTSSEVPYQAPGQVEHELGAILLDAVDRVDRPLVFVLDDLHYADTASLRCLAPIIPRLRTRSVLFVLSEADRLQPHSRELRAELPHEPVCRSIRLELLSRAAVREVIARRLGDRAAEALYAECHELTGGNPLLVHSAIGDYKKSGRSKQAGALGAGYGAAVLSCLYRSESAVRTVANSMALLGRSAPPEVLGLMAGLDADVTLRAARLLGDMGLVNGFEFRHPDVHLIIADAILPDERSRLRARAAELLYLHGAPAADVAGQLVAADITEGTCVVPILHEATEQALAVDQVDTAMGYLRLAQRSKADDTQQATTIALMARTEWRIDPALAARHMPRLNTAIEEGRLTGRHALLPVNWSLWFGDVDSAAGHLRRFASIPEVLDNEAAVALQESIAWRERIYPAASAGCGRSAADPSPSAPAAAMAPSPAAGVGLRSADVLGLVFAPRPAPGVFAEAEHILQENGLGEQTITAAAALLVTLICGERLVAADAWCKKLIAESASRRAPAWQALFTALRAEVALRRGELPAARALARAALSSIQVKGWGIAIGVPLGTLLRAEIALGNTDETIDHLRVPMPEAMFQSPVGLLVVHARSKYQYAMGRHEAALESFLAIGRQMQQWGVDSPGFVPWRGDAAFAAARLGRHELARELAGEQLGRLASDQLRLRAMSLRALAESSEAGQRVELLRDAARLARSSSDRLELALCLAALGQALRISGEHVKGRMLSRKAFAQAKQCGVMNPAQLLLGDTPDRMITDEPPDFAGRSDADALSRAESRVAVLAAKGLSNRQIASTLSVTVSTVEQHLTHVYRKLRVKQRSELRHDHRIAALVGAADNPGR